MTYSKRTAFRKAIFETLKMLDEVEDESTQVDPPMQDTTVDTKDESIDAQLDRYFMQYEEASKLNDANESFDFRDASYRLLEADDEEPAADAGGDEEGAGDVPANELEEPSVEKKGPESIDMGEFTQSVVRLIDNFNDLIDVRNVIVKRAENFLGRIYTKEVINVFEQMLAGDYDVEVGKSVYDQELDVRPPPAKGAGSSGA